LQNWEDPPGARVGSQVALGVEIEGVVGVLDLLAGFELEMLDEMLEEILVDIIRVLETVKY
jgi:hypothetical protein